MTSPCSQHSSVLLPRGQVMSGSRPHDTGTVIILECSQATADDNTGPVAGNNIYRMSSDVSSRARQPDEAIFCDVTCFQTWATSCNGQTHGHTDMPGEWYRKTMGHSSINGSEYLNLTCRPPTPRSCDGAGQRLRVGNSSSLLSSHRVIGVHEFLCG